MTADNNKVIPVKVALRIRPLVPREKADACTECLRTILGQQQIILGKDKSFTYDYVFPQSSPQIEIYETAVQPLVNTLFKGYNATVLAYGQTGSGKTHTMGSGYASLSVIQDTNGISSNTLNINDFDDVGVIPRVLNDLFMKIEEEQAKNKDAKFWVKVSFVEVYNEEIKDLFGERGPNGTCEPLNIREENNTIRVVNLSEIVIKSAIETIRLLEKGSSLRVVGGTAMNDQSSRSHAIFTITLEQSQGEENDLIKSKFHLVDLAGSERQSKTKAEGIRLKEGININLGLLALGNVISVLGEENPTNKVKHVPYRESKLTRLLQDSLGGNSHTVMIACVSPADSNMEESLNTLRYADRARKIKNKPIVNIDPQAAELVNLRQQVQDMKAHIYRITGGTSYTSTSDVDKSSEVNSLKDENEKLKAENTKLLIELNRLINTNRLTYDRMLKLESEKEEQTLKFQEIKQTVEKINKSEMSSFITAPGSAGVGGPDINSSMSNYSSLDQTVNQFNANKSLLLSELQNKLGEFDQLKNKEQLSLVQDNDQNLANCENEPLDKDFALKQAKMQYQLTEYDTELMKKQQLFQKMLENNMNKHENKIESDMEELKTKIEMLEKEKEDLLEVIRNGDATKSKVVSEQKRDRLKQLEVEFNELKKQEKDFKRNMKIKEENEKHCERLRQEIQHIKQERVKLIKQMKSDTETFKKYKSDKEKEVNQLKALERKRLVEITKLQEGNNRQENVLRRKNEEISRIQRQLRETSEKQKQVQEKRQQAFDRKDSSSQGDKLRSWVTQEIEVSAGLAEAQINLNKLIQERRESAAELAQLKKELSDINDNYGASSSKRNKIMHQNLDSTYVTNKDDDCNNDGKSTLKNELEQKIRRIEEDIECKNVQINEIQQMVIEGDQGLNQELKEIKKKNDTLEEDLSCIKKSNSNEINNLTQYYEQRIFSLVKSSAFTDPNCTSDERYDILFEHIQAIEKKFEKRNEPFHPPCITITGTKSHVPVKRLNGELRGDDQEKFRRSIKRTQRDHRKTHVIRPEDTIAARAELPEFDPKLLLCNITNSAECKTDTISPKQNSEKTKESSISYLSPYESWSNSPYIATPIDDKTKDPDWDWSKTPLGFKNRRSKQSLVKNKSFLKQSKSKSNLKPTDLESLSSNDENREEIC